MDRDTALADHTILVDGDRIVWVGPARDARPPSGARRIDGAGGFVVPGLADMHVHLDSVAQLERYLDAGVTVVRQMNGRPQHVVWRNRVARGTLEGPRIYTAGPAIRRPPHPWGPPVPRTRAEAEAVVRAQRLARYDMVKVQSGIDAATFAHLVRAARAAGLPVVGHVMREVGRARSLAAGQVGFEHADLHLFDGEPADVAEGARAFARAGAWVGTLVSSRDGRCAAPDARTRTVIAALRSAGVRLLAGTDAGIGPVPHGASLHCELATLVRAGLSPYEALAAATWNAGTFARDVLGDTVAFGTVTVGARADLVLLPGDPRADIGLAARPRAIVLRGAWRPAPARRR